MSYATLSTASGSKTQRKQTGVRIAAAFQILRAVVIAAIACAFHLLPDSRWITRLDVRTAVYLMANHPMPDTTLITLLLPLYSLLYFVVGCGLLALQKWARNITLATSGLYVFSWARGLIFASAWGDPLFSNEWQRETVYTCILLNIVLFCAMSDFPD